MKRMHSRRGRALRWLLFLAVLVAFLAGCNIYNFTPAAALRDLEREMGLEKMTVLTTADHWELPNRSNENGMWWERYTLSAVDDTLVISELRWDFRTFGWQEQLHSRHTLQKDGEKGIQILWYDGRSSLMFEVDGFFVICGRVTDPGISEVTFRTTYDGWGAFLDVADIRVQSEEFAVEEFVEWNGERLFLAVYPTPSAHWISECRMIAPEEQLVFDKNGWW